ncbi:glycosyltransferase family 39 protein [Kutzneria viridogrisea]|uniref:4-amino-4-deoxy-L-arabinose transferase-like glycosyltransferase n=1 Tax=Kutzneria viridogrisea TaxID=47990 RepID=A0ABR6BD93_9PSEU|nr:4-amino-4-deoxy-L-arabinose transferase-like glycosyltransferase [Kutzneria viridogrisea]
MTGRSRAWFVAGLAAVAFALAFWAVGEVDPHYYYTVAVRSMSTSWHDFLYGAYDPAGSITVDKIPGALWVQALFVRVLGFHPWVVLLPQALALAGTVPVLYDAVRRWAGTRAGLIAAVAFTLTPISVVLARVNIPDTVLVLLLVCAANAATRAVTDGRWRPLLLAGVWVGLAFQVKMAQAFLVLPGLFGAFLLSGHGTLLARLGRTAVSTVVTLAVSGTWVLLVALTPASARPYVDGSTHNSVWEMVFVYNGFGRLLHGDAPSGQLASMLMDFDGPPGLGRVFGPEVGWLLPVALIALAYGLVRSGRAERPGWVLWGSWLVLHAAAFCLASGIHPYYTAALAPAVAALAGAGLSRLPSPRWAVVATVVVLAIPGGLAVTASAKPITGLDGINPVVGQTVALPAAGMATMHGLPADAKMPPGLGDMHMLTPNQPLLDYVRSHHGSEQYLMAVPTANTASPYLAAGESVLPMGGFTGAAPFPSTAELASLVDTGRLRYVMVGGFHGMMGGPVAQEREQWVTAHCKPVDYPAPPGPPERLYDCG